jgi:hypothetical protein
VKKNFLKTVQQVRIIQPIAWSRTKSFEFLQLPLCPSSTQVQWLNWKEWDSLRLDLKKHYWRLGMRVLTLLWNGSLRIWKTQVGMTMVDLDLDLRASPVDIDEPIQTGGGAGPEPSPEIVSMLSEMGFTAAQARKALKETVRYFYLVNEVMLTLLHRAAMLSVPSNGYSVIKMIRAKKLPKGVRPPRQTQGDPRRFPHGTNLKLSSRIKVLRCIRGITLLMSERMSYLEKINGFCLMMKRL